MLEAFGVLVVGLLEAFCFAIVVLQDADWQETVLQVAVLQLIAPQTVVPQKFGLHEIVFPAIT